MVFVEFVNVVVVLFLFFCFFFFLCCVVVAKVEWWLWPVVVVVVGVADGRGGCGWFFGSGIYYFIGLKAKINPLLQHIWR